MFTEMTSPNRHARSAIPNGYEIVGNKNVDGIIHFYRHYPVVLWRLFLYLLVPLPSCSCVSFFLPCLFLNKLQCRRLPRTSRVFLVTVSWCSFSYSLKYMQAFPQEFTVVSAWLAFMCRSGNSSETLVQCGKRIVFQSTHKKALPYSGFQ